MTTPAADIPIKNNSDQVDPSTGGPPPSSGSSWSRRHHTTPTKLAEVAHLSIDTAFRWANPAWLSVASALALSILGLMAIRLTEPIDQPFYFNRQIVFLCIAILAAVGAAIPHPKWWRVISYPLACFVIFLLIFLLIPFVPDAIVHPRKGARRWINLIVTDFQPSELGKITLILALANYLRIRKNYRTLSGLLLPFAIILVPAMLILVEPDLGTTLIFPVALSRSFSRPAPNSGISSPLPASASRSASRLPSSPSLLPRTTRLPTLCSKNIRSNEFRE